MHAWAWRFAWLLVVSAEAYLLYLYAHIIFANSFIVKRRISRALTQLVDVFDSGTAVVDDNYIVGSFQGRSAWVSRASDGTDLLYISIRGRFALPFEMRTSHSQRPFGGRDFAPIIAYLVTLWSYLLPWDGYAVFHHLTFDNLLQYICWLLVRPAMLLPAMLVSEIMRSAAYRFRRRGTVPVESQLSREPLVLATTERDRFRAALDQPRIRESLTHLFDSCHTDGVKAPADGFNSIGAFWLFASAATKHALDKGAVRGTLTELSSLCAAAEQLYPKPV
jgi:hypothetical protein